MSSKLLWSIYGIIFGFCFPVIAVSIRIWELGTTKTSEIVVSDPLLWIIFTAPIFLGFFAYLGGRENDQVRAFSSELEDRVKARTYELFEANKKLIQQTRDQSSLLQGLEEGILTFDSTLQISSVKSPALENILPGSSSYSDYAEILKDFFGVNSSTTKMVFEYIWDKDIFTDIKEMTSLLGNEYSIEINQKKKFLKLRYQEQKSEDGVLIAIMVFIQDMTEIKETEEVQRLQREKIGQLSIALANIDNFFYFCSDTDNTISYLLNNYQSTTNDIALQIHTLKGNFRVFEFRDLAKALHILEDQLHKNSDADIKQGLTNIAKCWNDTKKEIFETLNLNTSSQYIRVSEEKLNSIIKEVSQQKYHKICQMLDELKEFPLKEIFFKFEKFTKMYAEKQNKKVRFEYGTYCPDIPISIIRALDVELVHIFNNCIDHGIEETEIRISQGKDPVGCIAISCERNEDTLSLSIRDDGSGIDTEGLVKKAIENKYWTEEKAISATYEEKIELIFAGSISTSKQLTESSGRGVGMLAVREQLKRNSGGIKVTSHVGKGTEIVLDIPKIYT